MDTRLVVSREDRKCWTLLDRIDQHTLDLVKFFKPDGDRLYAVLNDGRLITVGVNWKGRLGLGHTREVKTFEEITTLKGMLIKDIVCGVGHTMVVTEDGQLWGWGWNGDGQIGTGDREVVMIPRRILEKDVVDVKCGENYTLTLKKDGKVMTWGGNGCGQLGIDNTDNQPTPVSPVSLDDVIIDQIEAGAGHSIAVSRDGKAYGWGWNNVYQLGLGTKDKVLRPVPLNVHNNSIKSVACSTNHTLFLTRDGLMFVTNKDNGTLIELKTNVPVEHIACVDYILANLSSSQLYLAWASTESYFWEKTQQDVKEVSPQKTDLSLSQIISRHSRYQAFPAVLNMQQKEKKRTRKLTPDSIHCNSKLPKFSESSKLPYIEFVFPENKIIKTRRVVLSVASEYMSTKLCSTWKSLARVSLSSPSYSVFRHYLSYLYTHTVSFDDFDQLVSLVRLAHDYHEVDLQQVCVQHLCDQLDIDNCSQLYELAVDLKLEQLETKTSEMILQNIAQVKLTDGFKNMNREKAFKLFDRINNVNL